MKLKPIALALALTATASAQAAPFDFDGNISTHKGVIQINFSLATDTNNVKLWTDSFLGGINSDAITAVWSQHNTGWPLVGQNDDNASIAPGQTVYDSGLTFATYNNFANSTTLAQGFRFDNQTAVPLAQWMQPA